jgi:hypothetical protein
METMVDDSGGTVGAGGGGGGGGGEGTDGGGAGEAGGGESEPPPPQPASSAPINKTKDSFRSRPTLCGGFDLQILLIESYSFAIVMGWLLGESELPSNRTPRTPDGTDNGCRVFRSHGAHKVSPPRQANADTSSD